MTASPVRWLVPPKDRVLTPNRYGPGNKPEWVGDVDCLILHYTAGGDALGSARFLANALKDKAGNVIQAKASAHFVVGRAGEVFQLAPLDDRTWHAGGSSSRWRGLPVNSRSIGIEIANLGWLKRGQDNVIRDAWKRPFTGGVFEADDGGLWEAYTDPQLEAVTWLVESLIGLFPRLALQDEGPGELPRICGHQDVDPSRKVDPGPAFPMAELRAAVLGG